MPASEGSSRPCVHWCVRLVVLFLCASYTPTVFIVRIFSDKCVVLASSECFWVFGRSRTKTSIDGSSSTFTTTTITPVV